ncbi:MAG: response regulator transcription factor [Bacteroidia bacterium]|nr:response regulator transcription factor [Bacteroidia bacterium]
MQLRCLIVEDEKLAQDVLKKYISLIPTLQLMQCCNNASEAISYLHSNTIDLIFLDINMPELNGIDFLKTLQNPPHIIITTAYSEFALDGYEYSVCDYLLKPIRYERFVKAINKVTERNKQLSSAENPIQPVSIADHFFLKEDSTTHKILFTDLLYLQAFGNYLKVFIRDSKTVVTRATLTEIETQLPETLFLRVHKSYIVAMNAINKIQYNQIFIGENVIPVGTTFKHEVLKRVKRQSS